MIYLVTGVPGSGKTLYTVSTLVQTLLKEKVKGKDGKMHKRRLVVDGIPDLIISHEMLAPITEDEKGQQTSEGDSLLNWPEWCRPGDVIVVDEVQRYWRPRGMGTKPPEMIKALETHRHKGVDFIVITQHPNLIDQNVRRLVGRHQHVRRLWGFARAIIYDWDSCSVDTHRTKSATSTVWGYPKDAFKLYKSSELHTKQKQNIPIWLALPVVALIAGLAVAPQAYSALSGSMTGKGVSSTPPAAKQQAQQAPAAPALPLPSAVASAASPAVPAPIQAASAPAPALAAAPVKPTYSGCVKTPTACRCYDDRGHMTPVEPAVCMDEMQRPAGTLGGAEWLREEPKPRPSDDAGEVLAFMRERDLRGKSQQ